MSLRSRDSHLGVIQHVERANNVTLYVLVLDVGFRVIGKVTGGHIRLIQSAMLNRLLRFNGSGLRNITIFDI